MTVWLRTGRTDPTGGKDPLRAFRRRRYRCGIFIEKCLCGKKTCFV
jgi:hypothetical protein